MKLRIIGDVHQWYDVYLPLTEECDYSIQVGDMGFDYDPLKAIDYNKHRFIGGNHDNYDTYYKSLHAMDSTNIQWSQDFGSTNLGGFEFFFVRGGFSIDWKARQAWYLKSGQKTYWDEEELSMQAMYTALEEYKEEKPDVVITHECPRSISKYVGHKDILNSFGYNIDKFTTRTSELLQMMFEAHQPKKWYFGHYHKDWEGEVNGTLFRCLDELSYVDLEI